MDANRSDTPLRHTVVARYTVGVSLIKSGRVICPTGPTFQLPTINSDCVMIVSQIIV